MELADPRALSLAAFLPAPTAPDLLARLNALPRFLPEAHRVLLTGGPRSGKTSLLFQYAYSVAADGGNVVFMCRRAKAEQAPPLLPPPVTASDAAFKRIHMKYLEDLGDLRRYGACLHLLPRPPDALVIDDLSELTAASRLDEKRAKDAELTKALAYIVDALEAAGEQHAGEAGGAGRCVVVMSDSCPENEAPRNLYLLQRWFPLVLGITGAPPSGLSLSVMPSSRLALPPALLRARIHFTLTTSYIHVDGVST